MASRPITALVAALFTTAQNIAALFMGLLFIVMGLTASTICSANEPIQAKPLILVLGDSLSASFGIAQSQGWVSLLQKKLIDSKYSHTVINASLSGETTQGGASRLPALLAKHKPALLILELGGNDGLRGLPLALIKNSLQTMISNALKQQTQVLLVGMKLPPNYGQTYTERFHHLYTELATENNIALVPFLLAGFANDKTKIQTDGIHPLAIAQPAMLDNVWPYLKTLLPPQQKRHAAK